MKRITMSDVAHRAGVSKATVSHVINDTRFVENHTKQRVLDAISKLDYRPNAAARSLTTHRTGIIGMVISDATNLFFSEMLVGVEDEIRAKGYGLVVCNTNETLEHEDHYLNLLLGQQVEGIIAAATSQRWNALVTAEIQHTPVVFVDRTFEDLEGPFVGVDNRAGAAIGVQHLLDRGHRQIGTLAGFQRLSTMQDRLIGFRQTLQEAQLSIPNEWIVTSELTIEGGKAAAITLLSQKNRPSALFISNNLLCLGALLALKELGLTCPNDISIVTFDDHPWAAVSEPPLTVVRQPARQVGQQSAKLLCDILAGGSPASLQTLFPCELVARQSVRNIS